MISSRTLHSTLHACAKPLFAKLAASSAMAEKADPPSSSPPPSLSDYRWSRDEIPLSRREGEEVLAWRVRRPPVIRRRPPVIDSRRPPVIDWEVRLGRVCTHYTCPAPDKLRVLFMNHCFTSHLFFTARRLLAKSKYCFESCEIVVLSHTSTLQNDHKHFPIIIH